MAAQAEAEEEVRLELEAVAAVYGDDVRVLRDLPPHLVVHARPRTADDSSQQFVELFLGIKASSQEAGEILSNMNHPAGDCPLCLYPLVGDDKDGSGLTFMKLMSCYHCFHSRCIMRWWEWLQHGDANPKDHNTGGKHYNVNQHKGFCPVCRKVFDEKDIEHVHDLLGESASQLESWTLDLGEDEKELLHSEAEQIRRKRIESLVNLQQERNGLIEP